jgi:hypothetical protein
VTDGTNKVIDTGGVMRRGAAMTGGVTRERWRRSVLCSGGLARLDHVPHARHHSGGSPGPLGTNPDQREIMNTRSRIALPFALAFGVASVAVARPAAAQSLALAPSPSTGEVAAPAAEPTTGPTLASASVAVRHAEAPVTSAPARRGGYGQPVALMVVGGAALLTGLIIGNDAGTAIAVGGAVVGLIGLYQYLQ